MSDFVHVQFSPIFRTFGRDMERLRDEILEAGAPTLRREEEASIRERWYRTGATLRSLREEVVTIGDKKVYRLFPTARSERGAPYPLFGEYGTGRRGSASGRPAPRGFRHGPKPGMTARRFSRIAVAKARPEVIRHAQRITERYKANMTVN